MPLKLKVKKPQICVHRISVGWMQTKTCGRKGVVQDLEQGRLVWHCNMHSNASRVKRLAESEARYEAKKLLPFEAKSYNEQLHSGRSLVLDIAKILDCEVDEILSKVKELKDKINEREGEYRQRINAGH